MCAYHGQSLEVPVRTLSLAVLWIGLCACSGNRDSSIRTGQDPNVTEDAAVETPPLTPVRHVSLGPAGGTAASASYRARVLLSFPSQPALSRADSHALRLLPGAQP
jgi:hypothetical protein